MQAANVGSQSSPGMIPKHRARSNPEHHWVRPPNRNKKTDVHPSKCHVPQLCAKWNLAACCSVGGNCGHHSKSKEGETRRISLTCGPGKQKEGTWEDKLCPRATGQWEEEEEEGTMKRSVRGSTRGDKGTGAWCLQNTQTTRSPLPQKLLSSCFLNCNNKKEPAVAKHGMLVLPRLGTRRSLSRATQSHSPSWGCRGTSVSGDLWPQPAAG